VQFKIGDTVVHPNYGAGTITGIKELGFLDVEEKPYYTIQLLSRPETTVMVALQNVDEVGLRSTVSRSRLNRIWRILSSKPQKLPSDHRKRYEMLRDKLYSGSAFRIAEALRDLAWRKERKHKWTTRGKRLYDRGMELLAGEIASTQHGDVDGAAGQITRTLSQSMATSLTM
jgi:RNA polymerase-interacting CarD/CdnL/TRCF family regulator